MLDTEVTDANAFRLALSVKTLQSLPHLLHLLSPAARAVDHKQINITPLRIHLLDTLDAFPVAILDRPRWNEDLGGDEDVLAGQTRLLQRLADLGLILVELGAVDVSVAGFQCDLAGLDALVAEGLVDAESELGQLDGV